MKNKATIDDINAMIVGEVFDVLSDGRTTVCSLVLDNGFTVRGESSCVAIENFDAELGRSLARHNAIGNVWQFAGFRVAERLHAQRTSAAEIGQRNDLDTPADKAARGE